jgi:hypothetical protein
MGSNTISTVLMADGQNGRTCYLPGGIILSLPFFPHRLAYFARAVIGERNLSRRYSACQVFIAGCSTPVQESR